MKNSEDTIKLFNEVMDYFDSLSPDEFTEKIKEAEGGELTNLLYHAGYFRKNVQEDNTKNT